MVKNRRAFLKLMAGSSAGFTLTKLLSACGEESVISTETTAAMNQDTTSWIMTDEAAPHAATWMAFRANPNIWGRDLVSPLQDNLAAIAQAIAAYEPVNLLVQEPDYDLAAKKFGSNVNLSVTKLDDFWVRDTGPVFVTNDRQLGAVDFNFNGWGDRQSHKYDTEVAAFIAKESSAQLINTFLVLEGGGIEVDGEGTAIITESCVLNPNRNPNLTKKECENELRSLLGIEKIIWLPGIRGKDITDGHTDFYARFVGPGIVVAHYEPEPSFYDHALTKKHLEILRAAKDVQGRSLEVLPIPSPSSVRPELENNEFAGGLYQFLCLQWRCNRSRIWRSPGGSQCEGHSKGCIS